jgi:uncharacterized membrane protein YozB (DUF420 family)
MSPLLSEKDLLSWAVARRERMNKVARAVTIAVILYVVFLLALLLATSDSFQWRTGIVGPICMVIALIICPVLLVSGNWGQSVTMFVAPAITSVIWALVIGTAVDRWKAQLKEILRTAVIAAGVLAIFAGILLIRHRDIFYWTTGVIQLICEISIAIICPTVLIPHVISLRAPSFIEPVLSSLVWAMVIKNAINKRRRKRAPDDSPRGKANNEDSPVEHLEGGPQS